MLVTERTTSQTRDDDAVVEITLNDIVDFFRKSRRLMLISALTGGLLGTLYAFNKPNLYTAQVTVMPEIQSKGSSGLGSLGSLAGLAGINLDNVSGQQDAIRPDLYPNIVQSVPFALDLLKQPVYSEKLNARMTLQAFTERIEEEGSFIRLQNLFPNRGKEATHLDPKNISQAIQVTKEQDELIKMVQTSVVTTYEKKTGIVTIAATQPDPVVAAMIARLSLEYLTNYIISYRTEKARKQVAFLVHQVAEAENRYKSAEYALSAYRDRNRSLFLNTAKIDEQRLQADYLLAQSVYTDLSKQMEQAKIKVQEETPVFKTLEPPTIPLKKSGPKRIIIIVGFAMFGIFLCCVILLTKRIERRHLIVAQ